MGGWSVEFLRGVLDAAPEGIVVCECDGEDSPIAYANDAFLRLTGYDLHDLIGQDLRRLQGTDREQDGRKQLREAIIRGVSCRALLRNYRKDGSQFWNEVVIQPMRDDTGRVTHIVGFHRDVSERSARTDARTDAARPASGLPSWLRDDRLSGLYSRAYFEEMLHHDWQVGVRDALPLTLMMFDINELGSYNDTFGRPAGDACIRRVAAIIAARSSAGRMRWRAGRAAASSPWCVTATSTRYRSSPIAWRARCSASTSITRMRSATSSSPSASAPSRCARVRIAPPSS
jgi:PAS domain S-box-containing protein